MSDVRTAALRVAEALVRAKRGNYYHNGWDINIDRRDVETLLKHALTSTEVALYEVELAKA